MFYAEADKTHTWEQEVSCRELIIFCCCQALSQEDIIDILKDAVTHFINIVITGDFNIFINNPVGKIKDC